MSLFIMLSMLPGPRHWDADPIIEFLLKKKIVLGYGSKIGYIMLYS